MSFFWVFPEFFMYFSQFLSPNGHKTPNRESYWPHMTRRSYWGQVMGHIDRSGSFLSFLSFSWVFPEFFMSFSSFFWVFWTFSYKKHEFWWKISVGTDFSHLYRSGSPRWYHSPAKWWFLKFPDYPLFSLEFFGLWRPPKSRFSLPNFKKSLSEGWLIRDSHDGPNRFHQSLRNTWFEIFGSRTPKNLEVGSRGAAEDRFKESISSK